MWEYLFLSVAFPNFFGQSICTLWKMTVMYTIYTAIYTAFKQTSERACTAVALYFTCIKIANVWPARRLSLRPDSITKQACNGHIHRFIIQKPCPEIGFIYLFFQAPWLMVWREQVNYTKEMHFGPCAPQTGLTLWLPFCPLPCFWLILFNYSLFNPPPPPTFKMFFLSCLW